MHTLYKKNYTKVGILGGTFDPPHIGHLHISKEGLKKLNLNKIFWVVTKRNPFKQKPHLSTKVRVELSKKITKKERKIFIVYLDNKIKSKNTLDLLRFFKKKNKKIKLFFFIGADNFIKFHKWKNWQKIPKFAKIVVFSRKSYSSKALNSVAAKKLEKKDWLYINSRNINISSSLIRNF